MKRKAQLGVWKVAAGPGAAALRNWARKPATLAEVIPAVEKARGERRADFKDRHGDPGRDLVLYLARRATGHTVAELAQAMGLKSGVNVSMAIRHYEKIQANRTTERKQTEAAAQFLSFMQRC